MADKLTRIALVSDDKVSLVIGIIANSSQCKPKKW